MNCDLSSSKGNRANGLSGKPLEIRAAERVKLRWKGISRFSLHHTAISRNLKNKNLKVKKCLDKMGLPESWYKGSNKVKVTEPG